MKISGVFIFLLCLVTSGCASFKEYKSDAHSNFLVSAETEPRTFFTKITVELHLYRMNGGCDLEYLGGVRLNEKPTEIGIAPGQKTYLKFLFIKERFNSYSEMGYATIVTPKRSAQYKAEAKYAGRRYDVKVREVGPQGTVQEFDRQYLNCNDI